MKLSCLVKTSKNFPIRLGCLDPIQQGDSIRTQSFPLFNSALWLLITTEMAHAKSALLASSVSFGETRARVEHDFVSQFLQGNG